MDCEVNLKGKSGWPSGYHVVSCLRLVLTLSSMVDRIVYSEMA